MTAAAYKPLGQWTSDKVQALLPCLRERREALRRQLVQQRNPQEWQRLQGQAEEVDLLLAALEDKPR